MRNVTASSAGTYPNFIKEHRSHIVRLLLHAIQISREKLFPMGSNNEARTSPSLNKKQ
jgi:hypothetical protein